MFGAGVRGVRQKLGHPKTLRTVRSVHRSQVSNRTNLARVSVVKNHVLLVVLDLIEYNLNCGYAKKKDRFEVERFNYRISS